MVMTNSIRPFIRVQDGILRHLNLDDWPIDVPLPDGVKMVQLDGESFQPYQKIYLGSDKTVEAVFGWFVLPLSLEQALEWYSTRMPAFGYVREDGYENFPNSAGIHYRNPQTDVRVEINILHNRYLDCTETAITRFVTQLWSPSEADYPEPAVAES
jgi:hypothetical protein